MSNDGDEYARKRPGPHALAPTFQIRFADALTVKQQTASSTTLVDQGGITTSLIGNPHHHRVRVGVINYLT